MCGARNAPDQIETLRQIRATFVLVFHFRHHAQRLAKVLLMQTLPLPLSGSLPEGVGAYPGHNGNSAVDR